VSVIAIELHVGSIAFVLDGRSFDFRMVVLRFFK
jgi:hypothetical protein